MTATRGGAPSTFVISHTPFTPDGEIDWDDFRALLARFRAAGIGVYVGGSGSGEGYSLLPDEVRMLLDVAVDELRGHVPVRAMGVEPRTAREMIKFGAVAAAAGVEAMQVYSLDLGHVGMPNPDDLERYYDTVLSAVTVPVVLSTHFSVGYLVPVDLLARLCERYESIIGINCSVTGEFAYLVQLLDAVDPRIEVHVGGPMHTLDAMAMGATGFLSSEANLAPQLAARLIEAFRDRRFDELHATYHSFMRLFALHMNGMGGKPLQRHLGLPGGYPRPPRHDRSTPESLRAACEELHRIEIDELAAAVHRRIDSK